LRDAEKVDHLWTESVAVEDVPETGLHRDLEAPEEVRSELARLAGLRAVPRLSAAFDLTRSGGGLQVSGRVQAEIGQTCVVTLEPLDNVVDEAVDLLFLPDGATAAAARSEDAELPDTLIDGKVDLAAIAIEFFMLGIDPYPRKPGVEFTPPAAETGGPGPFAALEALKTRPGGKT
jgi:hypothetical protein